MTKLVVLPPREQQALDVAPHDRWLSPAGEVVTEFYRKDAGYLVRFPDQADFAIDTATGEVRCTPCSDDKRNAAQSLFHNAIEPLLGNYAGGLFLHGSVVQLRPSHAIAFVGDSRRGKTTLAGAFAKAGHPFLAEDTVALAAEGTSYMVQPTRPVLRLFPDSVRHLIGDAGMAGGAEGKNALDTAGLLPFGREPVPLGAIYVLGPGESSKVDIRAMRDHAALAELMRHGFILDVEDRPRLREHFARLGTLASNVPCYTLDFPREFERLPMVIEAIGGHVPQEGITDAD